MRLVHLTAILPKLPPRRLPVVLLTVLLVFAGPATAWGPLGHRLVAALAWDDLTPQARTDIADLLAAEAEPSLPGVATWADQVRANDPDLGRRSAPWHYVNIAEHDCRYDAERACAGGDCVVEAINAQAAILADRTQPRAARVQALKFVVHFVGDVHQPQHAGYGDDRGGNDVEVTLPDAHGEDDGSNLHALWDSGLLRTAALDEAAYLHRLRAMPLAVSADGDAAAWAETSCRIAVQTYPAQAAIAPAYVERWRPVAEAQLRRGGSHLAAMLNAALGG
ncbi:S1/P1 nuclease [Lysobacter sp. D1-1-M9]|uniref:S1/P1 nuclease n=1 Tax=Novilysobacter longmucuonensis TaxID=3098603 RepID=UPI003982DB85